MYPMRRRGKLVQVSGGCFASAEAAALSVARTAVAKAAEAELPSVNSAESVEFSECFTDFKP